MSGYTTGFSDLRRPSQSQATSPRQEVCARLVDGNFGAFEAQIMTTGWVRRRRRHQFARCTRQTRGQTRRKARGEAHLSSRQQVAR